MEFEYPSHEIWNDDALVCEAEKCPSSLSFSQSWSEDSVAKAKPKAKGRRSVKVARAHDLETHLVLIFYFSGSCLEGPLARIMSSVR